MKSSEHSVPLHDDIAIPASKKVTLVAQSINKWLSCIHPSRWTGGTRWFTHVLVNVAAQGRSSTCKTDPIALFQKSSLWQSQSHLSTASLEPEGSKRFMEASQLLSNVVDVDQVVLSRSVVSMRRDCKLSYHLQISVVRLVSLKAQEANSQRSATDASANVVKSSQTTIRSSK